MSTATTLPAPPPTLIRLVTFEEPVFLTIQGEGNLVGTPSVFVRTYGCDFSCSWCDTKGSWQNGSYGADWEVEKVVDQVRSHRVGHAVITGGNPVLQGAAVAELAAGLRTAWTDQAFPEQTRTVREAMHVTLETQGSIFDDGLAHHVDLISLSPKLHDWREEPVKEWVSAMMRYPGKQAQIKVVCTGGLVSTPSAAIGRLHEVCKWAYKLWGERALTAIHNILQPEFSLGRSGVQMVRSALEQCLRGSPPGYRYPNIRVIPQVHKSSLFVK